MTARAIWKGEIRFADQVLPVKLYAAVQDRSVRFRLLHSKDLAPVTQKMVNPVTESVVPYEGTQRGFQIEPDVFVVLSKEEIDELEPPASRAIEITRFVDAAVINHQWYVRPYWLGPDDDHPETYTALALALEHGHLEGVARWVMRKKRYAGAIRGENGHLLLIALRHAQEVISASELPAPTGRDLDKRELAMADKLVEAMSDEFDPQEYRDEYRERVEALVASKAKGRKVKMPEVRRRRAAPSLASALEASLASIEGKRASA